jgi:hypothetical protein
VKKYTDGSARSPVGRPRSIPPRLIPELLQRRDGGEGYRMLSRWLKRCGIDASPAACRRVALRLPPYMTSGVLLIVCQL